MNSDPEEPVLVDSSAWIDYLRGDDSRARREIRRLVADRATLATTEPILMELLAGARDEAGLEKLERLCDSMKQLEVDPRLDHRAAAGIFRATRRRGVTVRKLADCLVAAVAIRHGVALVHKDADFEAIGSCVALRHVSLR